MKKSKILKELANNSISLEIALSRLMIISSDLGNKDLFTWASNELNGYNKKDKLPEYRFDKHNLFVYSGINGSFQVTKQPLNFMSYFPECKKEDFYLPILEGIKSVEEWATKKEKDSFYGRNLSDAAGIVYNSSGIQCSSIWQIVPANTFENIINTLRTTLLKILIELDKEYGNLDELDIDTTDKSLEEIQKINLKINSLIIYDNSISMRDGNSISKSSFVTGGNDD